MERVVVERELGSGRGAFMTRIPNSNHIWSSSIGSDVALVIWGIGSDVVLTSSNFQVYPECSSRYFYTQAQVVLY